MQSVKKLCHPERSAAKMCHDDDSWARSRRTPGMLKPPMLIQEVSTKGFLLRWHFEFWMRTTCQRLIGREFSVSHSVIVSQHTVKLGSKSRSALFCFSKKIDRLSRALFCNGGKESFSTPVGDATRQTPPPGPAERNPRHLLDFWKRCLSTNGSSR